MSEITLRGRDYRTQQPVEIVAHNGNISQIRPVTGGENLPLIAPGLVDLQVNGYGGADFNSFSFSVGSVKQVVQALWQQGVTTFMPTVITNGADEITEMVSTLAAACREFPSVGASVAGIHLEGPFLSAQDGPRGAHNQAHIQAPDYALFQRWQTAADGRIRLITLSPEWPNADDFIRQCVADNVVVSIGHTAASAEQIASAVKAGAQMSTHLGNGAHLTLPRHPNYIWEQLAQDDLWCAMIADGEHLPLSVLKTFIRAKNGRALLVSDVTSHAGMPPGHYHSHIGGDVVLSPEGRLSMANNPALLAGSVQGLLYGVNTLLKNGIVPLPEAVQMASVRPASRLNLPVAQGLIPGAPLDAILLREDKSHALRLLATYKNGAEVWRGE
ncbi:N-acetylglucosamine-6-phosphate deacetylase [Rahnella sp. ChDrAdgB13]|uniref:N-acetylglucosamine-6-phosphate deacetylase n=1 Tax=Rahnella sp. ChDrAdgB13 TaxID=1850581 RepID=UPI001AD88B65|nr:amidohydrolase family protein [Rahnella sp. ChDrAdgB13]